MADEKAGKKPEKEGGSGAEKEVSEAGGRHRAVYTCFADGASNIVNANWSWFTCWRCGALNYM